MPLMVECARELKDVPPDELLKIVETFDNEKNLADSMELMRTRLAELSKDIGPLREKKKTGAKTT
jgi:phosphopantothenate synthetase